MVSSVPALVIAAPSSGSGKTTIATGLIGALRQAGHRVAPFKVGPDFIDPGYHALAAGRPGRNLDPVLVSEELIGPLYRHGSRDADIAVVEGVMGLFDGRIDEQAITPARGSTAQVAELLGAPVVLVVDARGQSQSIGAVLQGFSTFHRGVHVAGVILNRVGSPRHEQVLRQACDGAGVPVLGAIPRHDELSVPSRHLGLVTAVEHGEAARAAVAAMTALIARHVDLAAVVALAGSRVQAPPWAPEDAVGEPIPGTPVVAMAAGRAFSFGYAEHAELLRAAGAQVVEFDPLGQGLPAQTAALVLPGGFPEQYLTELSANAELRAQIRELARQRPGAGRVRRPGLPDDRAGRPSDVRGAARLGPLHPAAHPGLSRRGGRGRLVAVPRGGAGRRSRIPPHHSRIRPRRASRPGCSAGPVPSRCATARSAPRVHASYLHTHAAAQPRAVARFVSHAAALTKIAR